MKKLFAMALALVMALSLLTACGDKSGKGANGGNNASGTSQGSKTGSDGVYTIPAEKRNALSWTDAQEKNAVIAEIPEELFKAIGDISYCNIQNNMDENWKYTLALNLYTDDDKAAEELEKIIEYYKSIGAAVTETGNTMNEYDVKFDFAESVSINSLSSSIQIQFSVVKK